MTGQRSNQLNYDPACAVVAPFWGTSSVLNCTARSDEWRIWWAVQDS